MSELPEGVTATGLGQDGPGTLTVDWDDGRTTRHDVRALRLACKCATCIDEWSGEPLLDANTVPIDVRPLRIEPVGRYGIQVEWSDGHSTGITTFETLFRVQEHAPDDPPAAPPA